ncbi:MAG: ATP-binding protein [Pirellulales bacterium]
MSRKIGQQVMELALLIGVQASGKSTFCRDRLFMTHVRINLDMLRTRHRERQLLETCLRIGQRFVVDNTNATKSEREPYIAAAKAAHFRVVGYYFQSVIQDCRRRNEQRPAEYRVPPAGLLGTYAKLELPSRDEGFDELYYVKLSADGFAVEDWRHEI